jgi:hypothetical protein
MGEQSELLKLRPGTEHVMRRRKLMTTRRHSTLWPKMQTRDVIGSLHAVPLRGRVSSVLVFNYI